MKKKNKTRFLGKTADEEKVKELKATLNTKFDIYETILAKQKYLGGSVSQTISLKLSSCVLTSLILLIQEFTLADLAHAPLAGVLFDAGVNFGEGRPNVNRWLTELLARDSWKSIQSKGLVTTLSY